MYSDIRNPIALALQNSLYSYTLSVLLQLPIFLFHAKQGLMIHQSWI